MRIMRMAPIVLVSLTALIAVEGSSRLRAAEPAAAPAMQPATAAEFRAAAEALIGSYKKVLDLYNREFQAGQREFRFQFLEIELKIAALEIELNPQDEVRIRQRVLDSAEQMLNMVNKRAASGMCSRSDLAVAECSVGEAKVALVRARQKAQPAKP